MSAQNETFSNPTTNHKPRTWSHEDGSAIHVEFVDGEIAANYERASIHPQTVHGSCCSVVPTGDSFVKSEVICEECFSFAAIRWRRSGDTLTACKRCEKKYK